MFKELCLKAWNEELNDDDFRGYESDLYSLDDFMVEFEKAEKGEDYTPLVF